MISPRASICFLYLLAALLPVATWANDFEAGAALAPVAASRIRLLTERVVLTQRTDEQWGAEAVYVFHNPTAEPIATTFAFPEDAICPDEEEDASGDDAKLPRDPSFLGLETWVRGFKVPVQTLDRASWSLNELCLGRLYAFDLTLAPDERVEVRHRYRFGAGGGIGIPAEVVYVTHTGALWNGPIGLAEFVLAPRSAAWGLRCAGRRSTASRASRSRLARAEPTVACSTASRRGTGRRSGTSSSPSTTGRRSGSTSS